MSPSIVVIISEIFVLADVTLPSGLYRASYFTAWYIVDLQYVSTHLLAHVSCTHRTYSEFPPWHLALNDIVVVMISFSSMAAICTASSIT
jgi:hypothetical protein